MKMFTTVLLLSSTALLGARQAAAPESEAVRRITVVQNQTQAFAGAELESLLKPVIDSASATGRSTRTLINPATHRILFVAVSSKNTPPAEYHLAETDVWIVRSGEGWVQMGGEIADPKTTAGGDLGGTAIRGGKKVKVQAGDIVNIPPKIAHQALVDPGASMSYFVVKVKESHTADYFFRP